MKITPDERDELDEHLAGEAAISKARALLPSFRTTMLDDQRDRKPASCACVPMGLQGDLSTFGGTLWFFADDRSHKVHEIRQEPRVSLSFQNEQENRYLHSRERPSLVTDRSKMRELFTMDSQERGFPGGVDDPHLVLHSHRRDERHVLGQPWRGRPRAGSAHEIGDHRHAGQERPFGNYRLLALINVATIRNQP